MANLSLQFKWKLVIMKHKLIVPKRLQSLTASKNKEQRFFLSHQFAVSHVVVISRPSQKVLSDKRGVL